MKMVSEPLHKAPQMEEEEEADKVKAEQLNNSASQNDDVSERKNTGLTEEEVVHAMKRVEVGPTPFLKKTFKMVEDPDTDPIVSWGEAHHSFVIWDSHQFSKTLLPKYFKHNNFSSFIRQLNIYGFKKVDSDRWEFANERFQGGKKHLLKSIKRRSNNCKKLPRVRAAFNSMKPDLQCEVEQLKKDQNMLRVETLNLIQKHEGLKIQLTNVEEQVRCAELKQYKMLVFLTRMAKKPAFVQQLIHVVKRHRLLATQCPISFPEDKDTTPHVDCKHKGYEQLDTLLSESVNIRRMHPTVPSQEDDNLCSSVNGSRTIGSGVSAHDVSYAYDVMSEKLMGKKSVVEVDVNVSNIYHELEDLIRKQDASRLVEQTS